VAKDKITDDVRQEQLGRISVARDLAQAAANAELVIEAVFEDLAVKQDLFRKLDAAAPPDATFASNTSSISITRLASAVSDARQRKFVGMHFFSPVPVMPLIELIRGDATDDATEAYVRELAAELAKEVILSRDRPGFIVNRMVMPLLAEAMRAYEQGLATAEDIDTGARIGLNHPMGPLELADFIGLDVCLHIMEVLHDGFDEEFFGPPQVLRDLVAQGHLGQKTGRGFYTYPR
jgi:3-hydroxybutyryl-CoA dehydrogenase